MEAIGSPSLLSISSNLCKTKFIGNSYSQRVKINGRLEIVSSGMLAPRKFMQRRKKVEVFKDAADEAEQKKWRKLMRDIEESGSAVSALRTQRAKSEALPRDLVLGTLVRFKQLKKWNIVGEGDKFKEAEEVFESLLKEERAPFKPDQKMFHMMIYMYKKASNYDQARKIFAQMSERGIPQSTVTFNSLMSFETNYKEVSSIYDQMQRAGHKPDVVSYALLINAYGKARREDEALAVFEEMLDAGVRPTRKAYNILLDAFAISGMLGEARTVFKSMRRDKCQPDLCSYATMVSAYVNASDMDGAEKFFRRLKEDGLKPNAVVYGTLMKGYAKLNNLEKVMRVYERMRMQGVEANQTIYTTIMDAYGKNSDFGSAVIWFKEMGARGFPPDRKAKNILLSLAKTPEEQKEANELVGNAVGSLPDTPEPKASDFAESDSEIEDDDELSGSEPQSFETKLAAGEPTELNSSI
ncbi:uncharacterized protein [Elaeis guineensis]|uniref:uncharacterized protein isoform X3 n=1 Tax=Elaeis guineensis var. tenera TaxID=51953 RepID=UPI003C6CE578